jgi:hypothetical protein
MKLQQYSEKNDDYYHPRILTSSICSRQGFFATLLIPERDSFIRGVTGGRMT